MGFIDELKRLARPYEDEEEEGFEEFDTVAPKAERKEKRAEQPSSYSAPETERKNNKVVSIHTTTRLQVVLAKPERFNNAPEIADHLRDKRTVVLNLERVNKELARRLLDFLSGVAYAQEGAIKQVTSSIFIITPYNVDILGDLVSELENNGMY